MFIIFISGFILSLLLEGAITPVPFTLVCLICFTVITKDTRVFLPAFLAGIVIDIFRMQQLGSTSMFYICFLLLILLYKKKYEIYSVPFILLATFFGSVAFLSVFGFRGVILQSLFAALVASVIFAGVRHFIDAKEHQTKERFRPISNI